MSTTHTFDNRDPESIRVIQSVLNKTILPWAPDSAHPPRFIRVNGLGQQVAIVTSWLGGFGSTDGSDGWGYKSCPGGQGQSTSGIEESKELAMAEIDEFLAQHFTGLTVLDPVTATTNDPKTVCDNPKEAHGAYGTGDGWDFQLRGHP